MKSNKMGRNFSFTIASLLRLFIQHQGTQHDSFQHNDNNLNDIQYNNIQHNGTHHINIQNNDNKCSA
jgi:hypothetical protein